MTFREKMTIEHPDLVDSDYLGGVANCPRTYGYEYNNVCAGINEEACTKCWDREIPGTEKSGCEMDVISALINLCNTVSLDYDKVVSGHLTINEDGVCCINDKPYDDRTELIMSIRLFVASYAPNVEFRRQVYEYFESKRREAV